MKKTYMTPELLAVTLQHQDNVLVQKSFVLEGPNSGTSDVKEFEFVDDEEGAPTGGGFHSIWDSEW